MKTIAATTTTKNHAYHQDPQIDLNKHLEKRSIISCTSGREHAH